MSLKLLLVLFASSFLFSPSHGHPSYLDVQVLTRNAPEYTTEGTHAAIVEGLREAALHKRDREYKASQKIDMSWQDAVIFARSGEQNIDERDITQLLETAKVTVENDVNNTIHAVEDALEDFYHNCNISCEMHYFGDVVKALYDDGVQIEDLLPPNVNVSFEQNFTSPIPDTTVTFRFDDLDLYLELETILNASASYTLPLIAGAATNINLDGTLKPGAFFNVDLILEVDGSLDITSGLHIKVDDHVALDMQLFGHEASGIDFREGRFELLPVRVQSADATFRATLRLSATVALAAGVPEHLPNVTIGSHHLSDYQLAGGLLAGVSADVAVFETEIKASPEDPECQLKVIQDYSLVLGATAGAQATVGTATYGPHPTKTTAIYTTTLDSYCTTSAPIVTSAAVHRKRQHSDDDLSTTKLSITIVHTAIQCPLGATGQCPVALQTTLRSTESSTTSLVGPSSEIENSSRFPTPTPVSITAVPFGTNATTFPAMSGKPTMYTPTPTNIAGVASAIASKVHKHKVLAIELGVGIGLGVPLLAVLAGVVIWYVSHQSRDRYSHKLLTPTPSPSCCCLQRRKQTPAPTADVFWQSAPAMQQSTVYMPRKSP
ncbi:Hypothetical predicted protein [Lecanosticta acicola]|uniref:Mid2 domain-containing protein n=1 Tax=Lecanosticta acicola TaxID=111012 RepID=A0AAI8Z136_9PEZI|nr:Hypothetical predicted protein [Lecanosticta acicola]